MVEQSHHVLLVVDRLWNRFRFRFGLDFCDRLGFWLGFWFWLRFRRGFNGGERLRLHFGFRRLVDLFFGRVLRIEPRLHALPKTRRLRGRSLVDGLRLGFRDRFRFGFWFQFNFGNRFRFG